MVGLLVSAALLAALACTDGDSDRRATTGLLLSNEQVTAAVATAERLGGDQRSSDIDLDVNCSDLVQRSWRIPDEDPKRGDAGAIGNMVLSCGSAANARSCAKQTAAALPDQVTFPIPDTVEARSELKPADKASYVLTAATGTDCLVLTVDQIGEPRRETESWVQHLAGALDDLVAS